MNELLKIILSLSLSGTILILLLLLLRPLCHNRVSWRWQYYIWLLVIARLLLPMTPETSVTGSLFRQAESRIAEANSLASTLTDDSGDTNPVKNTAGSAPQDETATDRLAQTHPDDTAGSSQSIAAEANLTDSSDTSTGRMTKDILPALCALWLMTAMLLFVRKITIYQSFVKYVNAGSTPVDDIALLERFGQIIAEQHVRSTIDLRVNALVSSPLLIGFLHTRIILPTTDLSEEEFYYTVLHELTHYKRRDMFYKWLVQLTICLHWFNPFVHLMGREINRLCELSCDERVISTFSDNSRKSYGDTLLNAIGTGGTYKDAIASVTLHESKELLKGRLDAIMKYRKIPKWLQATTLFLTGILVGGAVVLGAYAAPGGRTAMHTDDAAEYSIPNNVSVPDYTIAYADDIYYIMVDGADESDKPLSTVTQGCKKLVLVRKDEYATMGPFANHAMPSLSGYVKEQCRTLIENGRITQENAYIFIRAAEEIQTAYTAHKSDTSDQSAYYYTQSGYYQQPYIIYVGYNMPAPPAFAGSAYADTLLTLSDGSTMRVYFSAESAKYMTDETALTAITTLLERIIAKYENTERPVEAPFISSMEYVGSTDLNTLAEKYYREYTLGDFAAVFPALDSHTQQEYLARMFEDDEIGFFTCCLSLLEGTELYTELTEHYILEAYEQDNTSFFAALASMLDESSRKRWQEKCKQDGNSNYYYLLREENATIMEEAFEAESFLEEKNAAKDLSDEDFTDEITATEELRNSP